jgi:hypothetical protein
MKRVRELSILPPWDSRLTRSWTETPLNKDMWRVIVAELASDVPAVLALGRTNLALYTTFGGFEHVLAFGLEHGHHQVVDKAKRAVLHGETLLHPLKWAIWTHGQGPDDSLSLFQQVASEMDRAEPKLRSSLVDLPNADSFPLIAGGFVRVLLLRVLRRAGVETAPGLSEHYSDIDVWLDDMGLGWDRYHSLLLQIARHPSDRGVVERGDQGFAIRTYPPSNGWSDTKAVQCMIISSYGRGNGFNFAERALYNFDFTACQAGVKLSAWDQGEVLVTPACLYSLLTGRMFIGPRPLLILWPLRQAEAVPAPFQHILQSIGEAKLEVRLLTRFFKYMRLGYKDAMLSPYEVAHMARLLESEHATRIRTLMAEEKTDYMFFDG